MEFKTSYKLHKDNRYIERGRHSSRSSGKDSKGLFQNHLKTSSDHSIGDREKSESRNSDHKKNSDCEQNSESYYSDDYEDDSHSSVASHSPSSQSRSIEPRRRHQIKRVSSGPLQTRGHKKTSLKNLSNKPGGPQKWGYRSQSLNKDPPVKDVDLVTKRMLSARLLKINELKNELSELQQRLDEQQKENRALRRLQYRQTKALNKFEDTENEISQLISRHNNEVRSLRERLRKSQERERTTDRRLKDAEEELYRTKSNLQKLRKLAEDKQLAERDELARKLTQTEQKIEEYERRVKDLEKNLELSSSSFQRQLATEKKKAHEAQEDAKNLKEKLDQLSQKLKEKERELDTRNIYANRMLKLSPKKDETTPRKKGVIQNTSKAVQTDGDMLSSDFPSPPPSTESKSVSQEKDVSSKNNETEEKGAENVLLAAKEKLNREKEKEEKLQRDREQQDLEEKARKFREDWEKEEADRRLKENTLEQERLNREEREKNLREQEQQNMERMEEEQRKKELLLAKMKEIDLEKDSSDQMSSFTNSKTTGPAEHSVKLTQLSESVVNGFPSHAGNGSVLKTDASGRRGLKKANAGEPVTFGSYSPSFGKVTGRTGFSNQKSEIAEDKHSYSPDSNSGKDKKSNLMQQLFGTTVAADVSTKNELSSPLTLNKITPDPGNTSVWEKQGLGTKNEDGVIINNGLTTNLAKSRSRVSAGRPFLRAVNSLEDDIEEVTL
ncbi:lebercilin [Erpetoichthys calabaricus]|uniref:lebercilin n=1 Tax=Erpetoichthys calabaricus TaxID=27687 RepID=UPI002234A9B5|nr:lebercilin [Erpetoichthys calabaricus]